MSVDLGKVVRHKIIETTDRSEFEKEINDLTAKGWSAINVQTAQHYSEKRDAILFGYIAIMVKNGLR